MGNLTRNSTSITDLNLSFELDSNTGDLNKLTTSSIIRRSIETILTTDIIEKPFREDFGSDVSLNLFDVASSRNLSMLDSFIRNAIERGERRIILNHVELDSDLNNNYVEVSVSYTIRKTSETDEIKTMLAFSD